MKKSLILVITLIISLLLVGCADKKIQEHELQVIFFTGQNATSIKTQTKLVEGQLITEPEEPFRMGFRFEGWFTDTSYTQEWDFTVNKIGDKSISLFALWLPGFYSIDYELNGGTMPASFKWLEDYPEDQRDPETNSELLKFLFYKVGINNVLPQPTRTGYSFINWFIYDEFDWPGAPEGTLESHRPGEKGYTQVPTSLSRDLVMYAHWRPVSMSVQFQTNYPVSGVMNNTLPSRTLTYGYDFVYDSNHDGTPGFNRLYDFRNIAGINYDALDYEFVGWNSRVDGTGTWYGDGTGTPGESTSLAQEVLVRVYAQWKLKNE